jgi:hypothetical protein
VRARARATLLARSHACSERRAKRCAAAATNRLAARASPRPARSDKRLGVQAMTVSCDFPKVFQMGER